MLRAYRNRADAAAARRSAYIARVHLYRSRDWTCSFTGKTGLTYEEAALSEARSADTGARVRALACAAARPLRCAAACAVQAPPAARDARADRSRSRAAAPQRPR